MQGLCMAELQGAIHIESQLSLSPVDWNVKVSAEILICAWGS